MLISFGTILPFPNFRHLSNISSGGTFSVGL